MQEQSERYGETASDGPSAPDPVFEPRRWARAILSVGGAGLLTGVLTMTFAVPHGHRLGAVATSGLVAGAALLLGGLTGFLFAFPRFGASDGQARYLPNTNLEQVSDWLTKIIVGVGLVQAGAIARGFRRIVGFASKEIDGTPDHQVAIGAAAVIAVTLGFVAGYVQARVALPRWFKSADPDDLGRLSQRLTQLEERPTSGAVRTT